MNNLCNAGCGREKYGRSGMCKPCKNEYNKAHYAANKQYYITKANERSARVAQKISEYKESNPCTDCKNFFSACAMDFDHLSDKEFDVSRSNRVSEKRLWAEIAKCELVCSNCHRVRTRDRILAKKSLMV